MNSFNFFIKRKLNLAFKPNALRLHGDRRKTEDYKVIYIFKGYN